MPEAEAIIAKIVRVISASLYDGVERSEFPVGNFIYSSND